MKAEFSILAGVLGLLISTQAYSYTVNVNSSIPITTEVTPQLITINSVLAEILSTEMQVGTAIVQSSDKEVAVATEIARAQREADILGRQTERLEEARKTFAVSDSICSESASGSARQVGNHTRSRASSLGSGAGVSNQKIRAVISSPPVSPREGGYRSAAIHAGYCTAEEAERYGGTDLCPQISVLPGGDIEIRSLFDGAGEVGKIPELTFSQEQVDAGMAYMKNSSRHDPGRSPSKGDIKTATGREYQGLMTQFKAIQNAASQPQIDMIAASQANPVTREALQEVLQSPSASDFFNETGSKEAKRTGVMSEREYEAFEVGRRYANTGYETDLQAMSDDNLIRELIRVQSLNNWLQLGIKNELRQATIISGQQLALDADAKYAPQLQSLSRQMSAGVTAYD
ncbi:conjugal transfer protein TraW [Morganella psychrotolerans]|uniref:conjugal transfer protein TraW n=1 Tax=Morganella psychrotolerans TaxID=368603 RepID=UPI0039AF73D8